MREAIGDVWFVINIATMTQTQNYRVLAFDFWLRKKWHQHVSDANQLEFLAFDFPLKCIKWCGPDTFFCCCIISLYKNVAERDLNPVSFCCPAVMKWQIHEPSTFLTFNGVRLHEMWHHTHDSITVTATQLEFPAFDFLLAYLPYKILISRWNDVHPYCLWNINSREDGGKEAKGDSTFDLQAQTVKKHAPECRLMTTDMHSHSLINIFSRSCCNRSNRWHLICQKYQKQDHNYTYASRTSD